MMPQNQNIKQNKSTCDFGEGLCSGNIGASSGLCSRGLLLTRQPLHWAELSRHSCSLMCVVVGIFKCWELAA